jgi:hypothetical protein
MLSQLPFEFLLVENCIFQEIEAAVVDGNGAETGHIIVTTIGGKNGQPKQVDTQYEQPDLY